jgi:hypothetical protein
MVVQCGAGLIRSPPVSSEERLPIESHLATKHVIDGTGQLLGQDGEGFAFVMFFLQAGEVFLGGRMVSAAQDGGCRKGPLEGRIADLRAGRAIAFASGFLGTCDPTTIGGEILDPGEALASLDFIEQHTAENLAETRDGLQQIPGVGVMVLGGVDAGQFDITKSLIGVCDERRIDFDTLLHRGVGKALGHALAVGRVGALFAKGRQVILTVGMLHMRQELGAFVCQMHPAPQQVAGGTHRGGIDIGWGEQTAAQQRRHLWRIDLVVCGLTAMDGLHLQGMPEDKRATSLGAEVGEPVPSEHTLSRHDHPLSIRGNGLQQGLWSGLHITRHQDLTALVEDADIPGPSMQVDATIKRVLRGVKSPEVSSFLGCCSLPNASSPTAVCRGGGLHQYQRTAPDCLQRPLRSRFRARHTAER